MMMMMMMMMMKMMMMVMVMMMIMLMMMMMMMMVISVYYFDPQCAHTTNMEGVRFSHQHIVVPCDCSSLCFFCVCCCSS